MKEGTFIIIEKSDFEELMKKINTLIDELQESRKRVDEYGLEGEKENNLLTPKQLADKLKKSVATIYTWRTKGIIKAHKVGGSTFFDFKEVLAAIKNEGIRKERQKWEIR